MAALAKNENQVSECLWKEEVGIGKLFCFVAGKEEAHRSESRVGRMRRSSKSGLRGGGEGKINLFLMQDDFTDDVAPGKMSTIGGMSVGRRREGRDIRDRIR